MLADKAVQYGDKENKDAFMLLRESGEIKGYTGCNSFGGVYEQNAQKLALSKNKPMLMTKRFCAKSPEAAFVAALNAMQSYEIKGEYLEIFDKEKKMLARFESLYLY
jgi:heat shock protein HslJ